MDAVMSFNSELAALYECKPPISKAKMTSITKAAIKAIKCYKHVVQSVEKFIQKCKQEYKIPGLYVIDSIVRQSRHQFGSDKDVFAPRFGKNILVTFYYLFKCPPEDKSRVIRVLNLWQKNNVFDEEVIQPVFDLADPSHHVYKEISYQIHQKATRVKHAAPPPPVHTTPQQSYSPPRQYTPKSPQTPQQQSHYVTAAPSSSLINTTVVSSLTNEVKNTVTGLDPNLIQQIQQILMKTEESPVAVAALNNLSNQNTSFLQEQPPMLGIPNQVQSQPNLTPIHQPNLTPIHQPNLTPIHQPNLTPIHQPNLTPIHQPPPAIIHPPVQPSIVQEQKQIIPGLSMSGDYDERSLPFVDTSLPPPGYMHNLAHVHSQPSHIPSNMTTLSQKPPSPKEEGEHSGESDEDKEKYVITQNHQNETVIQIEDRSRSPSYNRSSRRSRRKSRSRSSSRSHHRRSRSRGRRSRSRDRDRRYRDKDRGRSRRDSGKDHEREKEKERKKKGLPTIKSEHLSVCSTTLWIGHLSKLVHQEELSDTFGEYGDIVSIDLIPPRGCAFICMNRRQDAARALLKLRNYKILNKAITIAWAPGKGVKGKDFKDYWEVDAGCSYVPYSKLTTMDTVDLDSLEEGGMIDEDTVPSWLKGKLSARFDANQREAHSKPPPMIGAMAVLPPVSTNPLTIIQTIGKDLVTPIIPPPFTLPNVPPPRLQPGVMPPLGPPMMPPLRVPPPIGLPPLTSVQNILGQPIPVPPHITMAATSQHLAHPLPPPPHIVADHGTVNSAQDSDSMDVEMEDVQKSEVNIHNSSQQPMDIKNEQKNSRFDSGDDVHMSSDPELQQEIAHSQPPPFGIKPGNDMSIRFGIVPRCLPAFGPRGMEIGAFLGPPPPIIGGRPGIVTDGPRPFRPMGMGGPPPIDTKFMPPHMRFPMPPGRPEEEKGNWADKNDHPKFINKDENRHQEEDNMFDAPQDKEESAKAHAGDDSRPPEPKDQPRFRDRNRMRDDDRSKNDNYRNYDRNPRDRGRDRYDREPYGRDRYRNDRRDQWNDRNRWQDRRGWRDDGKPWNDERKPWNDERRPWNDERKPWNDERKPWNDEKKQWNDERKPWNNEKPNWKEESWDDEPQESDNGGWMNSEEYSQKIQDNSNEVELEKVKETPKIQQGEKRPLSNNKTEETTTETLPKQRKERDSTRVSRWGREINEDKSEVIKNVLTDKVDNGINVDKVVTPPTAVNLPETFDDKQTEQVDTNDPVKGDKENGEISCINESINQKITEPESIAYSEHNLLKITDFAPTENNPICESFRTEVDEPRISPTQNGGTFTDSVENKSYEDTFVDHCDSAAVNEQVDEQSKDNFDDVNNYKENNNLLIGEKAFSSKQNIYSPMEYLEDQPNVEYNQGRVAPSGSESISIEHNKELNAIEPLESSEELNEKIEQNIKVDESKES